MHRYLLPCLVKAPDTVSVRPGVGHALARGMPRARDFQLRTFYDGGYVNAMESATHHVDRVITECPCVPIDDQVIGIAGDGAESYAAIAIGNAVIRLADLPRAIQDEDIQVSREVAQVNGYVPGKVRNKGIGVFRPGFIPTCASVEIDLIRIARVIVRPFIQLTTTQVINRRTIRARWQGGGRRGCTGDGWGGCARWG
mgnify:CR=1 FL=1